jgi:hypothetical protein
MDNNPYEQIPAKPTKYKGRLFRSRLEARVAAYLDLRGWVWEYEPVDFPKWSPDFSVILYDGRTAYVEVKPDQMMFTVRKYLSLGIDLEINPIALICPTGCVTIFENGFQMWYLNEDMWTEAGNTVMFLKPEYNG